MFNSTLPAEKSNQEVSEKNNYTSSMVIPPVDIMETEGEIILVMDLPGVKNDDVDVRFEKGELVIHANRTSSHSDKRRSLWEYETAHFHRSFRITQHIEADKISAIVKNGILTIHLPKVESMKPKKITVKNV